MLKGSYRSFTADDRTHCYKARFDTVFNFVPSHFTLPPILAASVSTNSRQSKLSSFTRQLIRHGSGVLYIPPRATYTTHSPARQPSKLSSFPVLPSPALIALLSPTGLVGSLPPLVFTLSINARAGIDTLVRLVRNLPLPTGIKTLKTRSAGGDLMQLQQECTNRGIRLMSA